MELDVRSGPFEAPAVQLVFSSGPGLSTENIKEPTIDRRLDSTRGVALARVIGTKIGNDIAKDLVVCFVGRVHERGFAIILNGLEPEPRRPRRWTRASRGIDIGGTLSCRSLVRGVQRVVLNRIRYATGTRSDIKAWPVPVHFASSRVNGDPHTGCGL